MTFQTTSEAETRALGARFAKLLRPGDMVLFEGPLGAGKTTLIRGIVHALGHRGSVRSPTYNLIQTFDTTPRVMHADLYRVESANGIGLEDYTEGWVCLIEWPDRLRDLVDQATCHRVRLSVQTSSRKVEVTPAAGSDLTLA